MPLSRHVRAFRILAWRPILVAVGVVVACPIGGSGASAATLGEVLRAAVANSPTLAESRAGVEIATEQRVQAQAGEDFRVDLAATAEGRYSGQGVAGNPNENTATSTRVGVEVTRSLFDGGRSSARVSQAEAGIQSAGEQLVAVEQQVLFEAADAYFGVLRAEELLSLAESATTVLAEELAAAESRLRLGIGSRTDVARAGTRLAAARSNFARNQGSLEIARSRLARAAGEAVVDELVAPESAPTLPATLAAALDEALGGHPEVRAARAGEAAARAGLAAAQTGDSPNVSYYGTASYLLDSVQAEQGREDIATGIRLSLPLYPGSLIESANREAVQQVSAAQSRLVQTERRVRDDVIRAWENVAVSRAQIRAGESRVAAAELVLEGVRERAALGSGSTLEVLDAEQEAQDARSALIGARFDEQVATYRLRLAMGTLTVARLEI